MKSVLALLVLFSATCWIPHLSGGFSMTVPSLGMQGSYAVSIRLFWTMTWLLLTLVTTIGVEVDVRIRGKGNEFGEGNVVGEWVRIITQLWA